VLVGAVQGNDPTDWKLPRLRVLSLLDKSGERALETPKSGGSPAAACLVSVARREEMRGLGQRQEISGLETSQVCSKLDRVFP